MATVPKLRLGGGGGDDSTRSERRTGRMSARSGTAALPSRRGGGAAGGGGGGGGTQRSNQFSARSARSNTQRSERSQYTQRSTRSQDTQRSARTPQSVRAGNNDAGLSYRSELATVDEMDFLRTKKERLTAELWDVMGALSMEAARRAGHKTEEMPSRAKLVGTGKPLSLTQAAQHAFLCNRFGTTSQRSYNTISISGAPQLVNNDRRYARKTTDMSRYGEARAKSMKMNIKR